MLKPVLGHINCPTCGGIATMRITQDKNGDPFGYCAVGPGACRQQLRIGGDDLRVESFVAKYPWAGGKEPVTVTAPVPAPKKEATPAAPVPVTAPAPKKATFADALKSLGGAK